MVVTFMCAWAENIVNALSRAVTLILRCESKFPKVKSLVSTHSACPCKNCLPKGSQTLINYLNLFFFYLVLVLVLVLVFSV